MPKAKYRPEQIIPILREAEAEIEEVAVGVACRHEHSKPCGIQPQGS